MAKNQDDRGDSAGLDDAGVAQERLTKFLELLEPQGVSQREVAQRAEVPAQYLSDIKGGRRRLTERIARRLEDAFGIDHRWLLGHGGSMDVPPLAPVSSSAQSRRGWLPVFSYPISGDPYESCNWDGTWVELAGIAAVRVLRAKNPYVLRFGAEDRRGRLRRGDLVLITQEAADEADIHVVKAGRELCLARRDQAGRWERVNRDLDFRGEPTVIGHCLGIVWGLL